MSALAVAADKRRYWTTRRDELIRQRVAAGEPLRSIAKDAGLSHTAIAKIAAKGNQ